MTRTTWPSGTDGEIVREHECKTLRRGFTELQARAVAAEIGLDLDASAFDLDTFRRGMEVELEHGLRDPETNVTNDDPCITGKIAWAHLKELPDYYDRLDVLEQKEPAQPVVEEPPPPDAREAEDLIRLEPPVATFHGSDRR